VFIWLLPLTLQQLTKNQQGGLGWGEKKVRKENAAPSCAGKK